MACGMGWRKNTRAHTGARGHVGVEVPREIGRPKEPTAGVLGWIFFGADVGDVWRWCDFFSCLVFFLDRFFFLCVAEIIGNPLIFAEISLLERRKWSKSRRSSFTKYLQYRFYKLESLKILENTTFAQRNIPNKNLTLEPPPNKER